LTFSFPQSAAVRWDGQPWAIQKGLHCVVGWRDNAPLPIEQKQTTIKVEFAAPPAKPILPPLEHTPSHIPGDVPPKAYKVKITGGSAKPRMSAALLASGAGTASGFWTF
jgi:hypothetical protein